MEATSPEARHSRLGLRSAPFGTSVRVRGCSKQMSLLGGIKVKYQHRGEAARGRATLACEALPRVALPLQVYM